jgi:uncharacterized protein (TIGR00288 family)
VERNNYALLVDLENCGGKAETLKDVIEKVKIRGDILLGKVYGYNERYSDLKELLLSNTFNVVPSIRWGYNQKNNLDILLVIDAIELAFSNPLIDCFCIVSGDSDYTPLVGKLKSMGKYVLGISRSEVASKVFINACNEFIFLESVSASVGKRREESAEETALSTTAELNELVQRIINEQAGEEGYLYASELKKTINRIRPDFDEKNYGFASFGKLLANLAKQYKSIKIEDDNHSLKVSLVAERVAKGNTMTRSNWKKAFGEILSDFKQDGFTRVNPSIVKAAIQRDYPDFDERQIGFNRFSELMKELEKEKMVKVEFDESHSMLLKIL